MSKLMSNAKYKIHADDETLDLFNRWSNEDDDSPYILHDGEDALFLIQTFNLDVIRAGMRSWWRE
jgi:hypothetical protein